MSAFPCYGLMLIETGARSRTVVQDTNSDFILAWLPAHRPAAVSQCTETIPRAAARRPRAHNSDPGASSLTFPFIMFRGSGYVPWRAEKAVRRLRSRYQQVL